MNKFLISIFFAFSFFFVGLKVHASTFQPTENLFSSTQADNLILMAQNQVKNFNSYFFAIFRIDNNYYLVTSKDVTINSNNLSFNNALIVSAERTNNYGEYIYSIYSDTSNSTIVYLNKVIISNITTASNTVASELFNSFKFNVDVKNIGIFILGLCFAIFLTRERRY